MVAGTAAGELVDRGKGPFTVAEMQAWAKERTVRAAVLRYLLIEGQWPVDAKGVWLRGVRISGHLDLEAATLRCPLLLDCCYLDADELVCLEPCHRLAYLADRMPFGRPGGQDAHSKGT